MRYILGIIFACISAYCYADSVYTFDGDRIHGQLVQLEPSRLIFETSYKATLTIPTARIQNLETDTPVRAELLTGKIVVGHLRLVTRGDIAADTIMIGEQPFKLSDINLISRTPVKPLAEKPPESFAAIIKNPSEESTVIGQKPDDDIRKVFLRDSGVLLKEGQWQFDSGASYSNNATSGVRMRSFTIPVGVRYGMAEKTDVAVTLPGAWVQTEALTADGVVRDEAAGIGDFTLAANHQFIEESVDSPDLIGTIRVTSPSGGKPDINNPLSASTGNGFWMTSARLAFIRSLDPVAIFGGIEYIHAFKREISGSMIAPGDAISFNLGASFAVNSDISFNNLLLGSYQAESSINGKYLDSSAREPWYFRSALTYRIADNQYVEPSVTFGLSEDATDIALNLSYSIKL